jgi:hypothetical protein
LTFAQTLLCTLSLSDIADKGQDQSLAIVFDHGIHDFDRDLSAVPVQV